MKLFLDVFFVLISNCRHFLQTIAGIKPIHSEFVAFRVFFLISVILTCKFDTHFL